MIFNCISSTSYSILPGVPIVLVVNGWSFTRLASKLDKPFSNQLASLLVQTLQLSIAQTPAVFGYQYSDKLIFVLSPIDENSFWLSNNLQDLCSGITTLVSVSFTKLLLTLPERLNLNGEALFRARVFPLPNLEQTINFLVESQRDSQHWFFDTLLNDEECSNLSLSEKIRILNEENVNWKEYSNDIRFGTSCYKEPRIHESRDGSSSVRRKWVGNKVIDLSSEREFLFQILLNGHDVFRPPAVKS